MQDDIDSILQWCGTWLSFLNLLKCHHSTISHSSSNTEYSFSPEDDGMLTRISTLTEKRDLGIVFNRDLKFTFHVNQIVMKANRILGTIKRIFACRDANTINCCMCVTLVHPIFGLCINCLEPSSYENIRRLEAVQRRATKLAPSFYV